MQTQQNKTKVSTVDLKGRSTGKQERIKSGASTQGKVHRPEHAKGKVCTEKRSKSRKHAHRGSGGWDSAQGEKCLKKKRKKRRGQRRGGDMSLQQSVRGRH